LFLFACSHEEDVEKPADDREVEASSSEEDVATNEQGKFVGENPIVTITMQNDEQIVIELYPDVAPNTVNNFISLINEQFYDGLIFHRVIDDFMIQGGDPLGNGTGDAGYSIAGEFQANDFPNNLKHDVGVISMARSNHPDSASSQFFITVADSSYLNDEYAAFGEVIEGMEYAESISKVKTDSNDKPIDDQTIKTITVDTFGQE